MNESNNPTSQDALLRDGDLINDRELASPTDDRLDHERIANQLVDLVTRVDTPTNVALYGPWGSGKSGIANLVHAKIKVDKAHKGTKFARFDAFKYAENPFRRNFIIAVADELGVTDAQFGKDLYAGKTTTTIKVPDERKVAIAGWFLGLTVVLVVVLCVLIGILAVFQSGSWGQAFSRDLSAALPGGLLAPALLAAVFTLVGKSLTVDRSIDKPESVEEFENLFVKLVKASKADKLVIFVDELDRCSAKEVVATLDAIRTFLGVDKCVFIVAADQYVLEKALSEEARQETPDNSVNPYYSTGSAYLDKVFQYQISLPALLPQSVTGYAIELVAGQGGLWDDIKPVDYAVSVLIPSHVTSPRRVKHLLNTFALTYRLAESKHAAGELRQNPEEFTQALARLVCLRVEFPNFARDLTLDPHLPDYVLALYDDPETDLGERVSRHVRERALAYATGQASPARLISGAKDTDPDAEEESEGEENGEATRADDDDKVADREPGTRAQQGRQLITYLTRTRLVDGPSRDLIYMHSVEAVYGLEDGISAVLAPAVENGQHADIANIFKDAPDDQKPKVVQFIAGQIPATFGIERLNAAHSLMRLALRDDLPNLEAVADTAGQAIAEMHSSHQPVFSESNIEGGWNLAVASDNSGADTLKRTILEVLEEHPDWDATFLFDTPQVAIRAANDDAIAVLARELTSSHAADAARRLSEHEPDVVEQVLNAVRTQAGDDLAERNRTHAERESARNKAIEEAEAAGTEPDEPELTDTVTPVIAALEALANDYLDDEDEANSHPALGWLLVHILLLGDHQDTRNAAERLLPHLGTTSDPRTISELLRSVQIRVLSHWIPWLNAVDTAGIQQNHASAITEVARNLFSKATNLGDEDVTTDIAREATDGLTRLTESDSAPDVDLDDKALALLQGPVTTDAEAQARMSTLTRVTIFTTAGYVAAESVATQELATMRQTLTQGLALQPDNSHLAAYITSTGPRIVGSISDPTDEQAANCIAFAQEVEACGWLGERLRTQTAVAIRANLADVATTDDVRAQAQEEAPDADTMVTFIAAHGTEAAHTLAEWIRLMRPDRASTQHLIQTARDHGALNDESANAVRASVANWPADEQLALVRHFVSPDSQGGPDQTLLHAIGYDETPPEEIADILRTRFRNSGSNAAKQAVLTHWQHAPNMSSQTETLYNDILMPWLRTNTNGEQNADAVQRALTLAKQLAAPVPSNLRDAFGDLVAEATDGNRDLTRAAIPALEALGYSADRTGIFHSRLKVNDES